MKITLDYETRSACNLRTAGVAKYAQHPTTKVLCCAYSINGDEPLLWLPGQPFPTILLEADELHAHNAQFERYAWQYILNWPAVPLKKWYCTAGKAAYANIPRSLDNATAFMKVAPKDKEGHKLMMKVTKIDGPSDPATMKRLYEYCKQDVRAELALDHVLPEWPEHNVWMLDRVINERGVPVDTIYCTGAIEIVKNMGQIMRNRIPQITNGEVNTPQQTQKILDWVNSHGANLADMKKASVEEALEGDLPDDVRELLEIRTQGAPASVKKYGAALDRQVNGRINESLMYYGAGTGRWAGRGFQTQNLTRGAIEESFVQAICTGDVDILTAMGDPIYALQHGVRQIVTAPEGHKLLVSDFSAIEARVTLWAARSPRLKVYRDFDAGLGPEPYVVQAASIFGVRPAQVTRYQRQVGKVAVLGLGYGTGSVKFRSMAKTMADVELSYNESKRVVDVWRQENNSVVQLWHEMEAGFRSVVNGCSRVVLKNGVVFETAGRAVTMTLPNGRKLYYWDCKCSNKRLSYYSHKGFRVELWGGVLVENLVQAIARDMLIDALARVENAGIPVVMHVHDEVLACVPEDEAESAAEEMGQLMAQREKWAAAIPIVAPVGICKRYTK